MAKCVRCGTRPSTMMYKYNLIITKKSRIGVGMTYDKKTSVNVPVCTQCGQIFRKYKHVRTYSTYLIFSILLIGIACLIMSIGRNDIIGQVLVIGGVGLLIIGICFTTFKAYKRISKNSPKRYIKIKGKKVWVKPVSEKRWIPLDSWDLGFQGYGAQQVQTLTQTPVWLHTQTTDDDTRRCPNCGWVIPPWLNPEQLLICSNCNRRLH